MKKISLSCIVVLAVAAFEVYANAADVTKALLPGKVWNRSWEFRLGEKGEWQPCHLPHSFSAPYFMGADFYVGDGWYRKTLSAGDTDAKSLFLDFEGAFQFADVWLDGVAVGSHSGGYTSFRIDLTPALKRGKAQEVLVKVSNRWDPVTCPRAGEHIFPGGINRNVRLVRGGDVVVVHNGITITTPEVSNDKAVVEATVLVTNMTAKAQKCKVGARMDSPTLFGKAVDGAKAMKPASETASVAPNGSALVKFRFEVAQPNLWSPSAPHLYPIDFGIDGKHWQTVRTGLRFFKFTKDEGFFLNGEHLFLLGANCHQDIAGWVDGRADASQYRDVKMMKDCGFNFIRGSHYPHAPAFIDACDELGIAFWSEGGLWGNGGKKGNMYWNASVLPAEKDLRPAFEESAKANIREMISDAKNHPAVIAWSVSNEPFFNESGEVTEAAKKLAQKLVDVVREEDPTRPAAIGGAQRGGFDKLDCDLIGYNGDGALIFRDPPGPNLVSEYGSRIYKRPGKFDPGWHEFRNDRPAWRSGAAVWCGFDHGSVKPYASRMGIVDYYRVPKRGWHWYRENIAGVKHPEWPKKEKPAKIVMEKDLPAIASCDGLSDVLVTVRLTDAQGRTVDDLRDIKLKVVSGPAELPTGREIVFGTKDEIGEISMVEGVAAIAVRSHFAGKSVLEAWADGLEPARLEIDTLTGACRDADARWKEGVSKRTPDRPYVRYRRLYDASGAEVNQALNKPCHASSNHRAQARGNDDNKSSAWTPDKNDKAPYWTLDMESVFPISRVSYTGTPGAKLSLSADGDKWKDMNGGKDSKWNFPTNECRFIKFSFPVGEKIEIRETSVY